MNPAEQTSITTVLNELQLTAQYLRKGCESMAQELLTTVTGQLLHLSQSWSEQKIVKLNEIITQAFDCQRRHDWLGLADYLEFELVDFLCQRENHDSTNKETE
ncbi:hypothetical protein [Shewanella cyperi]|uniref:hypothetical protein n=1 Tax=Shewanella cyperi TaxID=2814292 RepID=UPI001A9506C1|nr:hypothetical protein [Shewanella cyperi]QSX39718.1 hypothetical protein JYB84_11905 [Shewanella cyperi]